VVIGVFLYVLGGTNDTGILDSIERASIQPDGSVGPFATVSGVALSTARREAAAVVLGNGLYVLGGTGSGVLSSIERSTINSDGSLEPFAAVPGVGLTSSRTGHSIALVKNTVYVIGGSNSNSVTASIERASITDDGSLGAFSPVDGVTLVTARADHTSAVIGNAIYVVGGSSNNGALASIEQAQVHDDGSLGTFVTMPSTLGTARTAPTCALLGNFLYLIGGHDPEDRYPVQLERANINTGSSFDSFSDTPQPSFDGIPTESIVIGPSLYVFGFGEIDRASIGDDGTPGPLSPIADTNLPPSFGGYAVAVVKDKVYLLGGLLTSGGISTSDAAVRQASISADGSVGQFSTLAGVALTNARWGGTAAVVGNAIYVIGGQGTPSVGDVIERSIIKPDGTLGPFTAIGSIAITGHAGSSTVVSGHSLYVIINNTSGQSTLERASIGDDSSLGQFEVLPDMLPDARRSYAIDGIGQYIYLFGGISGPDQFPVMSIERAIVNGDGSLSPFTLLSNGLKIVRSLGTVNVIGNNVYLIGGIGPDLSPLKSIAHATLDD
jgi:hypothetical protein